MGISKWLVAAAALAAFTNVQAQEKTRAYIATFAGYTHLRLNEGTVYEQDDTVKFDALTFGGLARGKSTVKNAKDSRRMYARKSRSMSAGVLPYAAANASSDDLPCCARLSSFAEPSR